MTTLNTLALVGSCLTLAMLAAATQSPPSPPAPQPTSPAPATPRDKVPAVFRFTMKDIDGKDVDLATYQGKVVLMVNVASECGLTPQYADLQALHEKYVEQGLVILGFPANEFGGQEPGSNDEIKSFCTTKYSVEFPMFAKVDVNGPDTHPVYAFLKREAPGVLGTKSVKWNFTKFLVDRSGKVVKRYASTDTPKKIDADVRDLL